MNCNDARHHIRLWLQTADADSPSAQGPNVGILEHMKRCTTCRLEHGDAVLDALLRQLPAPVARDGFLDRALVTAVQRNTQARPAWQRFGALAASLAAVALTVVLWGGMPATGPVETVHEAGFAQHEEQTVRIVIDSVAARDSATITIELAENLELSGFPDRRVIEWQTDLLAGKNLLALPLRLKDQGESYLNVSLRHDGEQREIRVSVRSTGASSPADALPMRA
jgi:hypothetical protein